MLNEIKTCSLRATENRYRMNKMEPNSNSFSFKTAVNPTQSIYGNSKEIRLVVVRYFLDRNGRDVKNSAARLWFHVPKKCKPDQIRVFLAEQGITIDGLIVEIFLEKFGSFMLLEACEAAEIEWNFEMTNCADPGFILIRLTDTSEDEDDQNHPTNMISHNANTTPIGLLAFSMTLGLESAVQFGRLVPGSVGSEFLLMWYPYAFFVGGLLQLIVGVFATLRNNIYGSVAFLTYGCVWLANGSIGILAANFSGEDSLAIEYMGLYDKWGRFGITLYLFAFACSLLVQTFALDKLSTLVIVLLVAKYFFQLFAPWYETMEWIQVILQCIGAVVSFAAFFIEFTNQVYHGLVINTYKWSEDDSPNEIFAAPGAKHTLLSTSRQLRQAQFTAVNDPRHALPDENEKSVFQHHTEKKD